MSAQVKVEFIGDASSLKRTFNDMGESAGGFGKKLGGLATVAGGVLAAGLIDKAAGAAVDGFKTMIDAASDTEEAINKVGVVFGDSADDIDAWSETTAESLGISQRMALDSAGTFGTLLKNFGLGEEAAAGWSKEMVGLAADMGSFNNASPEETLAAIGAGLRGESEPLRRFGVMLDDASLKAQAMTMGLYSGKGALDANAKAQAALALIMAQTTDQQGDFARTQDGLANSTKTSAAMIDDLAGDIGALFLPVITELATFATTTLIPALRDFATVIGPILSAAVDQILPFLQVLGDFLMGTVLPAVLQLAGAIGTVLGPIVKMLAAFFANVLVPGIKALAVTVGPLLRPLIDKISAAFKAWAPYITAVVKVMTTLAGFVVPILVDILKIVLPILFKVLGVFFDLLGAVGKVAGALGGLVTVIATKLVGALSGLYTFGKKIVGSIIDGIKSMAGAILKAIIGILPGPVRGIISDAIGLHGTGHAMPANVGATAYGPAARAAPGPQTVNVNIYGGDPAAIEATVLHALRGYARRNGTAQTLPSW